MTVSSQGWPPESVLDAGDASEDNASGLYDTPGQRWYTCDRCGFLYPMNETIIEENTGLRVCKKDWDPPDNDSPLVRGVQFAQLFPGSEEVTDDGTS